MLKANVTRKYARISLMRCFFLRLWCCLWKFLCDFVYLQKNLFDESLCLCYGHKIYETQ